jgi:arylsulfatase A-like enzyme
LLNEKRFLLAYRGLFVVFILLASPLFYAIIASRGEFIQEASTQEEEIADDEGGGEPAGEATPEQPPPTPPTTPPSEEPPPNILLIISDDQPFYTDKYTPAILNKIFANGTTFSDAFLSTSLCCPSRASVLTGLYAHNHGTITNSDDHRLTNTTFFQALDTANLDYRTAMVGKYMNSQSGDCRKEFDYWVAFPGAGPWYNGTNKPLNVNCKWTTFNNTYSTYLLRDYALQFLNATITEDKPFVMWFAPFNPHLRATPAQEDVNLYPNGLPLYYLPPSFNEADVSDKPAWVQALPLCQDRPPVSCEEAYKDEQLRKVRNLASFDRSVEALLNFLDSKGELSNTLIIYVNDNGLFHGEHRMLDGKKNAHYKESVKAIMGARWEGHIPVGQTYKLVGNIDIAPTVYDALGLLPPYPLDGQSLLDLWRVGSEPWRQSFLIEHWDHLTHTDATIVTKSWSYTETKGDKSELYQRWKDPYELNNVWCSPDDPNCAYSGTINKLAAELRLLRPSWDTATSKDGAQVRDTVTSQDNVNGTTRLGEDGTTVTQDDVRGNITISCDPTSGSVFPIGDTEVECSATDEAGNEGIASFNITVNAPPPRPPKQIQTVLTLNTIRDVPWSKDVIVTGKLTSIPSNASVLPPYFIGGEGIGGRIITFDGTGASNLPDDGVVTNSNGYFTAKGASPATVASGWKVQAHFAGDSEYAASDRIIERAASDSTIKEYNTLKHNVTLSVSAAKKNVPWSNSTTFRATLIDNSLDGIPISGKTIHFNGTGVIGVVSDDRTTTNTSGKAIATGIAPDTVATGGTYQAHFYGDELYQSKDSAIKTYNTTKHSTSLSLAISPSTVAPGGTYNVSGFLIDDTASRAPLSSKTIVVIIPSDSPIVGITSKSSITAATDAIGKYILDGLKAPTKAGSYDIQAHFYGDEL